jgi:flagellar L-ring protein precursor FlgH
MIAKAPGFAGLAAAILVVAAAAALAPAAVQATPDSLAASRPSLRSWTSDRTSLRPGDLLTIVVDEQTAARERVSRVATGDRSMRGRFNLNLDTGSGSATTMNSDLGSGLRNDSRDIGSADRFGGLTAVLTVRVTGIEPGGVLTVAGTKKLTLESGTQEITVTGAVRPEDVSAARTVRSERLADAVITLKGRKIGPRQGLVGKMLGMVWP